MKKTVICVDDDINVLKALERLFRKEPFDFLTYNSPIKALDEIDALCPAVAISDLRMPEMKGTEFLKRVKTRQPTVTGIILTGHADLASALEAVNQDHVFSYIRKPWDDDELKAQVKSALQQQDSILCLRTISNVLIDEIIEKHKDHKAIRKLAAALCNELNQPLMIITGYVQLLKDCIEGDEIPSLYLSNIVMELYKLEQLKRKIDLISEKLETYDHPTPPKAGAPPAGTK